MELNETQLYITRLAVDVYIDELIARLDNTDWRGDEGPREVTINLLKNSLNFRELVMASLNK